jgi:CubicO group peptidase (beta-lactamase class C family)
MNEFLHDSPVRPEAVGADGNRLTRVIEAFKKQQTAGAFPGGQLVVRRAGKLVACEAVGIARGFRPSESVPPVPVSPQTPFPVLSAGKPLAAICIALLEDRGLLDIEAPIADVFPEFGRHGKEQITTLDVLTHRSGILMPDFVRSPDLWGNRAAVQNALAETVPTYPRGTLAYHPYEYGWVLCEVVLRVDGRSLPDFFVDELAGPLGLPALQFGLGGRDIHSLAFQYWLGKDRVMLAGTNVAETFEEQNTPRFFAAQNPAVSLVCDAASLAAFYDFLLNGGKTRAGQPLISEATLQKYTTRQVFGWDRTLRVPSTLGRGFVIGSPLLSTFGWWNTGQCFGHGGGFSSLAFGDRQTDLSVAIVTNGNRNLNDFMMRFIPLAHGLRQACRTLPVENNSLKIVDGAVTLKKCSGGGRRRKTTLCLLSQASVVIVWIRRQGQSLLSLAVLAVDESPPVSGLASGLASGLLLDELGAAELRLDLLSVT